MLRSQLLDHLTLMTMNHPTIVQDRLDMLLLNLLQITLPVHLDQVVTQPHQVLILHRVRQVTRLQAEVTLHLLLQAIHPQVLVHHMDLLQVTAHRLLDTDPPHHNLPTLQLRHLPLPVLPIPHPLPIP